jgi:hypothetical protein
LTWRVGLIDSCGGLEGIDTAAALKDASSIAAAAAFVAHDGRVERRETVADPTGHGSRIARLLISGPTVELLLGQVFTTLGPTSGSAVAGAIDWAVERRVGLIHLSLGLAGDRAVLRLAVQRAIGAGCILVAAMPARGAPVYPAAYPGVLRGTGDARCAPHQLSALGPWFFGGCPRPEVADRTANGGATNDGVTNGQGDGPARGGASIGAAWVTHAILQEPPLGAPATVDALTARARYRGAERRTPTA